MIVLLSFFHTKIGPKIFFNFPEREVDRKLSDRLYDNLTQQKEEEFFTQTFEEVKLFNHYFQVHSDWARGKREMLMISIMFNQQISPEIEEWIAVISKEFSEKMQSKDEIYKGFYRSELNSYEVKDQEKIIENDALIKEWIKDLYWKTLEDTRRKSEEEKLTLLLNDRYIFESLEQMAGDLKIISEAILNTDHPIKTNIEINNSISNLNNTIDELYEGFIAKMTLLDFGNEDDLFLTDEELDIDDDEGRKELLRVLEGEVTDNEE
ncbi:MAG: hypothetical protein ACW986_09485 [Promethearchaeota archaeon]|jgi:hypothetical protein